ncbi:MAG: RDD family protein [Sulfurimonas sp.]
MRFRKLKKQTKNNKEKIINSKNSPLNASIPDKIKAFITDMFMIYVPILYLLTYVVLNGKDDFQASNWAPFIAVSLYGLISSFLLYKFGQTPGNKAYTMKVVDATTHKNITFIQALLRFISFLVGATFLFGFIVPFYTKDKRSLHDIIAKTTVIVSED